MIKHDSDFYDGQILNPPRGYSTTKVDKKWEKTVARKHQIIKQHTQQATTETPEQCNPQFNDEIDSDDGVTNLDDDDFVPEEPTEWKKY